MTRLLTLLMIVLLAGACSRQQEVQTGPLPPEGASMDLNPVGIYQYQLTYNDPTARRAEIVTGQIIIRRSGEELEGEITGTAGTPFPITLAQVSRNQLNIQARTPDGHVSLRLNFIGQTFTGQWEAENRTIHAIRGTRR